jgi:hypothetical protein
MSAERRNARREKAFFGFFLARRQDLWRRARCHAGLPRHEARRHSLWRRAVLPRRHSLWRRAKGPKLHLKFLGSKRKFLTRKGLKNKKFGSGYPSRFHPYPSAAPSSMVVLSDQQPPSSSSSSNPRSCSVILIPCELNCVRISYDAF